jgi:hypothetical protein
MLSGFCCSITVLKWLRLLNEPLKKIMHSFYFMEALIWFSPWCIIWVDLAHAYNMLDSYKVTIRLYDHLVFDLWCHFMLLLMMFCRYAWLWPVAQYPCVATGQHIINNFLKFEINKTLFLWETFFFYIETPSRRSS